LLLSSLRTPPRLPLPEHAAKRSAAKKLAAVAHLQAQHAKGMVWV